MSAVQSSVNNRQFGPRQTASNNLQSNFSQYVIAEHGIDGDDVDNSGYGLWGRLNYPDSIRLFKLSRDPASGILQFALSEHRLSSCPSYSAISYVWGKPGNVAIIECKNGQRTLRRNLFALLNVLCNRIAHGELDPNIYLWVDALCINQESLEEKAQQVQQIGKTFTTAERVLIWLGTHQDGAPSCLDTLCGKDVLQFDRSRVATHEYWLRAWITQEFILAANMVLFDDRKWRDGDSVIKQMLDSWYSKRIDVIKNGRLADGSPQFQISPMGKLFIIRERMRKQKNSANYPVIKQHVINFRHKTCTDPRDKVFSLLSLASDGEQIRVDYAVNLGSLFWKISVQASNENNSMQDYVNLLSALRLERCDLLPQNGHLLGFHHVEHLDRHDKHLTENEWAVECDCEKRELQLRLKADEIAFTHPLDFSNNQSMAFGNRFNASFEDGNDGYEGPDGGQDKRRWIRPDKSHLNLSSFQVLAGCVRRHQTVILPKDLNCAIVLDFDPNTSSDWTTVTICAIVVPVNVISWCRQQPKVPLVLPYFLDASVNVAKIASMFGGGMSIRMNRACFTTMLALDTVFKSYPNSCCSLLGQDSKY